MIVDAHSAAYWAFNLKSKMNRFRKSGRDGRLAAARRLDAFEHSEDGAPLA